MSLLVIIIRKRANDFLEPDSLANLVTNLSVAKCANAASVYKSLTEYAISTLNLPNVSMYLDAGHGGWLGWAANIGPAADLFAEVYNTAGKPAAVRGLATNVANYNAWSIATCPSYTAGDSNCDEQKYINSIAPLLTAKGFPAHFIIDTCEILNPFLYPDCKLMEIARNGVQPTQQQAWGDWCNLIGTGFGIRPSTNTGNSLADAFVWIKPGGECDVCPLPSKLTFRKLTFILGNIKHFLCQIRCPLRSIGCIEASPRSRNLVPGILRATAHQRQPSLLSLIRIVGTGYGTLPTWAPLPHFV